MARHQHVQKPYKVLAEQYDAASAPAPAGVCTCTSTPPFPTGAPHVHTMLGPMALQAGDWIVEDLWSPHAWHVLPDAEFQDRFGGSAEV